MGTITLNTPRYQYQYDCSISSHAANGMVGTIIVEEAPNTVQVTFNVNMANETTSPDGVFLAGGADFGVAGDNPMSDDDGDDIWTITKTLPIGYTGNYTFLNGNCPDWTCKENIVGQSCADDPYSDRLLSNIWRTPPSARASASAPRMARVKRLPTSPLSLSRWT